MMLLLSCNSKKYLKPDQSFLYKNSLTLKSRYPIPNKSELKTNLNTLYRQQQTKGLIPRHTFYYQYQRSLEKHPDRKKWSEERLVRNRPVIHDSLKARQTCLDFEKYLALRGYRHAHASYRAQTQNKETTVYYHVDPGPRLYIDTLLTIASDTSLQRILDDHAENRLMKNGSPLDIDLFNQEKRRMVRILQNQGYATFDENFVSPLEVDTSGHRVKAIMRILNPSDSTFHLRYYIGDVSVYPDYDLTRSQRYLDTTIRQVRYFLPDSLHFSLKPEVLQRNFFLVPGHLSRREDLERTIRNLTRIEIVRFVNPVASIDTTDGKRELDYNVFISRNKKIDFQGSVELTYSNVAASKSRSLFGTSASVNYRDRNTFRGAEVLNVNLETGLEFNFIEKQQGEDAPRPSLINSVNIGVGGNLSFPRFMDPFRMYHLLGYSKDPERKPLIGRKLHDWLLQDASSRIGLGYSFVTLQDLYQYYSVNANLSYVMQPDPTRKLTIDRTGFDLFVPDAKPKFDSILMLNKFQRESFGKQLYTGFFFRDYLYELNTKSPNHSAYFKILHSFEISGLEILAINSLYNRIAPHGKEFILTSGKKTERDSVRFSHFVKGELDLRYYKDLGGEKELAFRFNAGLALPYGPYTHQVPYPKQFYVGGASSNRAWQVRELGPGGYQDPNPVDPDLPFYQTGDIKMDLSLEYRFNLFWYFKGGIFLDAANVWTLYEDAERPRANFQWKRFYREFGVGYGYGLRLDFDYFILRLDLGYKLFNPYPVLNSSGKYSRFLKDEVKKFPGGFEPQIAVGHKF